MKHRCIILCIACLFLQACQIDSQVSNGLQVKNAKNVRAAAYNTQLGLAYFAQGDRALAKRKLLLALDQDPHSPIANGAMAFYMEKTGELKKAQLYYKKSILVSPGEGAQLNNYGVFLCKQRRYQQAETCFLQAVNDIRYEHIASAYENAGLCAESIPDYKKAVQYFVKALEHEPSRKQSLYELISIDIKLKQLTRAMIRLKTHSSLVLKDTKLLALAIHVAHESRQLKLEANYKAQMQNMGIKHVRI